MYKSGAYRYASVDIPGSRPLPTNDIALIELTPEIPSATIMPPP